MIAQPMGDGAIRWPRPKEIEARALLAALRAHPGVRDVVVTEEYVAVYFDPDRPPDRPWDVRPSSVTTTESRDHLVRVVYDGADLDEVARVVGVDPPEVVAMHVGHVYEVTMIGFLPGFAYLRGGDPRLGLARRANPRPRVPTGSVAIAAGYTGIYPVASPGGWHLLGRAQEFVPWSPERGAAWSLGDRVRFEEAP
jgi:UPF0271 protein